MRNDLLKRAVRICLLLGFAWGCGRAWYGATDGFRMARICGEWPLMGEEKVPDAVREILRGPFRYLGRGRQMFVWECGDLVLKIPRADRYRPHFRNGISYDRPQRQVRLMQSLAIAREELREELGVVYVHLGRGEVGSVILPDRLGRQHTMSLDGTPFVLQRRCQLLRDMSADVQELGWASWREWEAKCQAKGIATKDPHLSNNVGWDGTRAIQMDVGTFYRVQEAR